MRKLIIILALFYSNQAYAQSYEPNGSGQTAAQQQRWENGKAAAIEDIQHNQTEANPGMYGTPYDKQTQGVPSQNPPVYGESNGKYGYGN